jgi:hypothetical protein
MYTGTLTADHLAVIEDVRDRWVTAATSTTPVDRAAAEKAIVAAYAAAGLPAPSVVWVDSPIAAVVAAAALSQLGGQLGGQLRDQLRDQLGGQLGGQLWDQLWDQLGDQLGDQLWDQLWGQLGDQLWDQLWGQLWDQLGGQLWGQLRGQLGDQLRGQRSPFGAVWDRMFWGQHEAHWVAFYAFAREWGVRYDETSERRLRLWEEAVRSMGWWWPLQGAVILTERPLLVSRDDEDRLHSETGPAVCYADGWTVCAVHGVRVPERVINRQYSVDDITRETNAEVRRVMIDLYGVGRYLSAVGAHLVASDDFGKLWRLDQVDDEPLVMVEVVNATAEPDGTFKDYFLRVPPDTRTPHEAVAWTFGMTEREYRETVAT